MKPWEPGYILPIEANAVSDALRQCCAAIAELVGVGLAVVDRWDSPLWKDIPHTGEYITRLRVTCDKYDLTTKETK